eukprot:TRINITY_DN22587_c0_g1_i2.p3 TRINITY_DN22587_c0_g1~~TRINITY_DN22587_c0_g1_i2.p3  ORF type:complete len:108 (-),score=11.00 TRINITY_DN22587_c0_g1_i2:125-448(-)
MDILIFQRTHPERHARIGVCCNSSASAMAAAVLLRAVHSRFSTKRRLEFRSEDGEKAGVRKLGPKENVPTWVLERLDRLQGHQRRAAELQHWLLCRRRSTGVEFGAE